MKSLDIASAKRLMNPKRDILIVSPYHPLRVDPGDIGIDLPTKERTVLDNFSSQRIATGVKVVLPYGVGGFVSRRSGADGIVIDNSPGVIDPSYRGEIKVIVRLVNKQAAVDSGMEDLPFDGIVIPEGWRLAQLTLVKVIMPLLEEHMCVGRIYYSEDRELYRQLAEIFPTKRGEGGFGGTGA